MREVLAPSGYKTMADVHFKVNDYGDTLRITMENKKKGGGGGGRDYTIRLKKVDEEGIPCRARHLRLRMNRAAACPCSGSLRNCLSDNGKNTGNSDRNRAERAGGYEKLEGEYRIQIPEIGDAVLLNGDETFYQEEGNSYVFYAVNRREPEQPEFPEDRTVGWITAEYDRRLYGSGKALAQLGGKGIELVKTGDDFPYEWVKRHTGGIGVGSGGLPLRTLAQKKEAVKMRRNRALALLALALSGCMAAWSPAAERENVRYVEKTYLADTDEPEGQNPGFEESILVDGIVYDLEEIQYEVVEKRRAPSESGNIRIETSSPFTDEVSDHQPAQTLDVGEETWHLVSWEVIDTTIDAREQPVSDVIQYTSIAAGEDIPEAAVLTVTDAVTGNEVEAQVPLASASYSEERWEPGFEFPVTIINDDAQRFLLNGKRG